jgi:hypothetical protein
VRRALPDALIVLGGPHAYPQAEKILRTHPEVDVIVVGEGEITFPRLVAARIEGGRYEDIAGLFFRANGAIRKTPDAPLIADLDALPSPYLTGAMELAEDDTILTVETSRGCVFDCSFCDWPGGRGVKARTFSIGRVIREMAYAIERAPSLKYFELSEADLFINKGRAKEFLVRARELLAGTNILIHYSTYFGHLDDELIRLLDCSNFVAAGGIQTATPEALKTVNRYFHREKIESAVRKLAAPSTSFRIQLELLFGLPGDDPAGFQESLDWALSLKPNLVCAYPALVLPGAEMGMHPERYDMVYKEEPPHQILSTSRFSVGAMNETRAMTFRVSALQFLFPLRNTLAHLAGIARPRPQPFLSVYEEFGRILVREGLLPEGEGPSAQAGTMDGGLFVARDIHRDGAKFDRAIAELRRFGTAVLADSGRSDLLGTFEHYWRTQENGHRWLRLAREPSPELAGGLDRDLRDVDKALWLGRETFTDESVLARRGPADTEVVHLFDERQIFQGACRRGIRHVESPEDLAGRRFDPEPADAVVLSHLYTRLEPAGRASLLSHLSRRTRRGSRLILWDDLLGRSPLESMNSALSLAGCDAPAREWTVEDVAREFSGHGWSLDGAEQMAGFHHITLSRD